MPSLVLETLISIVSLTLVTMADALKPQQSLQETGVLYTQNPELVGFEVYGAMLIDNLKWGFPKFA